MHAPEAVSLRSLLSGFASWRSALDGRVGACDPLISRALGEMGSFSGQAVAEEETTGGIEQCAAGDKCKADPNCRISNSPHRCGNCVVMIEYLILV